MGPHGSPDPPEIQSKAYGRAHSETRRERAERVAQEKALDDFRDSPAAREIAGLRNQIVALQQWRLGLRGVGGVQVNDTIIGFSPAQARVARVNDVVPPLASKDEGTVLTDNTASLNFVGAGVTATQTDDAVTVTIPGMPSGYSALVFRACVSGTATDYNVMVDPV